MRECEIVVLSKFPEYFAGFRESIENDRGKRGGVCVRDGNAIKNEPGWTMIDGPEPFQIARSANLGFQYANSHADILYCSDDIRLCDLGTVEALQGFAYSDPELGIVSPKIIGHGQEWQMRPSQHPLTYCPFAAFICVYLKREMIDNVGLLDERFEQYGHDDVDYCVRARLAGFKIAVAADIAVKHGLDGHVYGSTFIRTRGEEQMAKDDHENRRRFAEKYGIENTPQRTWQFVENLC